MIATHDVVVSGTRSVVVDSGPRSRSEAVVFVHGNPGPHDDWEFVLPEVARRARAVALDLPGFGRADRARHFDYSPQGYARHLGGVLTQLGITRAHLVMHDFGGAFGLCWALSAPGAAASVTLINCVPLSAFRWHFFARLWQTPLLGELFQLATTDLAIRTVMNRDNPRPLPAAFTQRVLRYADLRQKFAVLKLYRAARDPAQSFATLVPALRALALPACVIWGDADPYLAREHAESFRAAFASTELHRLPGLGHWPFVDDPDAVRALVLDFLERRGALAAQPSAPASLESET